MDREISQISPEPVRLERFRMILAEYDIVATGIKTLISQFLACGDDVARSILSKLRALEQKLGLEREAMWQFQVSDDRLKALLGELDRRCRGNDPLNLLSFHLERTKRLLSPLSHAIEALRDRNHDSLREFTPADNEFQ